MKKINFSDDFLSPMVHCVSAQPEILIFFSLSQNIHMVGISKNQGRQRVCSLCLVSLKMGVSVSPMCTVCRPKIFWHINPLPKGVQWCKSQENQRFWVSQPVNEISVFLKKYYQKTEISQSQIMITSSSFQWYLRIKQWNLQKTSGR